MPMPTPQSSQPKYTPTQLAAFQTATQLSTAAGPDLSLAYSHCTQALTRAQSAQREMASAQSQLSKVLRQIRGLNAAAAAAVVVADVFTSTPLLGLVNIAARAEGLMNAYSADMTSLASSLSAINRLLSRRQLVYASGVVNRYKVNTCTKYRSFSSKIGGLDTATRQAVSEVGRIKRVLESYGSESGRQRRNQTTQLMTDLMIALDGVRTDLTTLMRSGSAIRNIRRYIDLKNNNEYCGADSKTKYIGPQPATAADRANSSNYRAMTADEKAAYCYGLNELSFILQYTAAKQGRSWTAYRQRWNRLSNSDKDRNIITGLDEIRTAIKRLRNNALPAARKSFVDAFAGMSQIVGKTSSAFTASQRNKFGPVPQLALQVNDAFVSIVNARQAMQPYQSTLAVASNPMVIGCQSGSGYAGYGALEDKSPDWSPLLVMGGAVVLGMIGAHLHAKGV